MLKRIRGFFFDKTEIEYIFIATMVACVVILLIAFLKPETFAYFQRPISDMIIGEFLFWILFASYIFSGRKG